MLVKVFPPIRPMERTSTPILEPISFFIGAQTLSHKLFLRSLEVVLKSLNVRYFGCIFPQCLFPFVVSKPCKKPRWKEFEDTDDEKEYKYKLLKYRQWKYSLVCSKNVAFDFTPSKVSLMKIENETP